MKSDKAEIIAFKNDFANFPISKKACGVKVVELKEAKYCLDLDTFGTPIDFNLYPFGKGVPVLTKTLTSYPRPRKADDSPSDVTIDIRKHYPKKAGFS